MISDAYKAAANEMATVARQNAMNFKGDGYSSMQMQRQACAFEQQASAVNRQAELEKCQRLNNVGKNK